MASSEDLTNTYLNSNAINDEYFIEIVESKLKISRNEFKIRLVMLSPAIGPNENFIAVLYRAKIKIEFLISKERKSVDVIIKVMLSTMSDMTEMGFSPRERFAYKNILKGFEDIWIERTGELVIFGPRMFKTESDPYEQIVLDDLKAEGFEMANRKVGLNLDQTKTVLKKIAQFHATGAILYQKEGMMSSMLNRKETFVMPEDGQFAKGFVENFYVFLDAVRSYGDCDNYAEQIAKWDTKKLVSMYSDVAEPMRSGFQVLNHGDLWLNNMMFKSNSEGKTEEVTFVDFQMPYWGGPAGDLLYFLTTSVTDDIKIKHFDEFIEFYHQNLVETLKKLKFIQPIPTLEEVHVDLLDKGYFSCGNLIILLSVVKNDSPEVLTFDMLMSQTDDPVLMDRVYKNANYMKALKPWFEFFDKRGYLDAMMKQQIAEE